MTIPKAIATHEVEMVWRGDQDVEVTAKSAMAAHD